MTLPTSWNLQRYYYTGLDDPRFLSDIDAILPTTTDFVAKYESRLPAFTEPDQILEFYHDYDRLTDVLVKPSYYLFYLSSLDSQDTEIQKKSGEVDYIMTEASNQILFIAQAWKQIGETRIRAWADTPLLAGYRNDLISTAEGLKHILGEAEEKALNLKSRPLGLAPSLHEELTGSYEFTMMIDGEEKKMTEDEVRSHRQSTDRAVRREAYTSLRRVYNTKQAQITLANIYTSIVKDWSSEIRLRGYEGGVMTQRNESEELENEVVDLLLTEVEAAYPIYQRFLRAKAKMMGMEIIDKGQMVNKDGEITPPTPPSQGGTKPVFSIWDTGAPLSESTQTFTFEEALDLHLCVMKDFDSEFYDYSREMIEEDRVDVFPKAGKRGGAFASYRKGDPSFVLLNFTGKLHDVSTLSHELGHAIHGHLSQAQEAAVYDSPLSLAETASIFSEMLLAEKVKTMISPEEYKNLLNDRLSDVFATIFRQVQYILFEREVHETIHSGQEMTYKELNLLWRAKQESMNGGLLQYDIDSSEESGWSMIPHIFRSPFYCYAYAFGNLLTFALYNKVTNGELSVEDYKNILRAGGSERPRDLLARYGIDIASSAFYRSGLREVEKMVEEFEGLI